MKRLSYLRFLLLLALFVWMPYIAEAQTFFLHSDNPEVQWEISPAEVVSGVEPVVGIVPGTVFASYVAAGREQDPNYGDNIDHVDRNRYDRSFWYRTEFLLPEDFKLPQVWLCMNGVNRSAKVYLNGELLGMLDGFMMRGRYNITKVLKRDAKNRLEILVGMPRMPLANQGSPCYLSSGGWDWMPYVPGLNSGLTDKIWLSNTGDFTIADTWVRSNLITRTKAELTASMEVSNNGTEEKLVRVTGVVQPGDIEVSKERWIRAGESYTFRFDSGEYPQLAVNNPRLWWPNGYGEPHMYTFKATALQVHDNLVSQTDEVRFGIRKYTYDTDGGILHIHCNGVPIFAKGANWGMSEYMLRCRGEEYETKIRLHYEMHYNMIRNWLGSTTDDEFYEYCDKYGIMVWDDFWINSGKTLPYDLNAFNANMVEKIKRVRNHPCIAIWCGDNEGTPEPPLVGWMQEDINTFDGGDRYFQARSNAHNLSGSGYWGAFDERYYFLPYPCQQSEPVMTLGWGFRSEIGTAVVPTYESLTKFMPEDHLWPIDEMWNFHYFGPKAGNALPKEYTRMVNDYGKVKDVKDFCHKAQLVNYQSNRAMYEGWIDRIWEDASGILNWMGQSAFPSMVWQTYDYYYDMTGAFWGCRKGCEPVHIFWNPATDEIKVSNTTARDVCGLTAEAMVYNSDGSVVERFTQKVPVEALSNATTTCFALDFNHGRKCLSLGKQAVASSTSEDHHPALVCDGKDDTRWAAEKADNEWIYIDLGEPQEVGQIRLNFEAAYGRAYRLQISNDAKRWREIVKEDAGREGEKVYTFPEVRARYVRFMGIELGWWYGYSLWDFSVWGGMEPTAGLSDVHFLRLTLRDGEGRVVSENSYWHSQNRTDYSALEQMEKPQLRVKHQLTRKEGGKALITVQLTLPQKSRTIAVATHVHARSKVTGERLLPAIQSDDYMNIFPGETRTVTIEFDESLLQGGGYDLETTTF